MTWRRAAAIPTLLFVAGQAVPLLNAPRVEVERAAAAASDTLVDFRSYFGLSPHLLSFDSLDTPRITFERPIAIIAHYSPLLPDARRSIFRDAVQLYSDSVFPAEIIDEHELREDPGKDFAALSALLRHFPQPQDTFHVYVLANNILREPQDSSRAYIGLHTDGALAVAALESSHRTAVIFAHEVAHEFTKHTMAVTGQHPIVFDSVSMRYVPAVQEAIDERNPLEFRPGVWTFERITEYEVSSLDRLTRANDAYLRGDYFGAYNLYLLARLTAETTSLREEVDRSISHMEKEHREEIGLVARSIFSRSHVPH